MEKTKQIELLKKLLSESKLLTKQGRKTFLENFVDTTKYIMETYKVNGKQKYRYSTLVKTIQAARQLSLRDRDTGKEDPEIWTLASVTYKDEHDSKPDFPETSFASITFYLIVLDIIGEVFTIKNFTFSNSSNSKIYKALDQFSRYSNTFDDTNESKKEKAKIKWTLVALRNCLVHNHGLINISNKAKHKFIIDNDKNEKATLITFPTKDWSGIYMDRDDQKSTIINRRKLFELIEETYITLVQKIASDEVKLNFKLTEVENEVANNNTEIIENLQIEQLKARFTTTF